MKMANSYNGMSYIEGEPFSNSPQHSAKFIQYSKEAHRTSAHEVPAKGYSIRQFAINPLNPSPFFGNAPDYLAATAQGRADDAIYLEDRSRTRPDISAPIWDKTPEDVEVASQLQKWNYPIHLRLKQLLGPPLIELAQRTQQRIQENPDEIREIATMAGGRELSYSVASLPPNLFDHIKNVTPFLPQTDAEGIRLVNDWAYYHDRMLWQEHGNAPALHRNFGNWTTEAVRRGFLEELIRRRQSGDTSLTDSASGERWHRYRWQYWANFPDVALQYNAAFMTYPSNYDFTSAGGFFDVATEQCDSFILTHNSTDHWLNTQSRTPVGKYGVDFARLLACANYVVGFLTSAEGLFQVDMEKLTENPEVSNFLQDHLLRAHDRRHIIEALNSTQQEANKSVGEKLSWLTHGGVPGYSESLCALNALQSQRLPSKSTAITPLAVVGPSALHGRYRKDIYNIDDDTGRITFSDDYIATMGAMRRYRARNFHYQQWKTYLQRSSGKLAPTKPVRTGHACPFNGLVTHLFAQLNVDVANILAA